MSYSRILQTITPSNKFLSSLAFLSQFGFVNAEDKEHNPLTSLLWIPIGLSLACCAYFLCSDERRRAEENNPNVIRIAAIRQATPEESIEFQEAKRHLENQEQDLHIIDATTSIRPSNHEAHAHYQATNTELETLEMKPDQGLPIRYSL